MCRSMVDIQSAAAEIRRGIKKRKKIERKKETTGQKYNGPLLHRAAVTITNTARYHTTKILNLRCKAIARNRNRQINKKNYNYKQINTGIRCIRLSECQAILGVYLALLSTLQEGGYQTKKPSCQSYFAVNI